MKAQSQRSSRQRGAAAGRDAAPLELAFTFNEARQRIVAFALALVAIGAGLLYALPMNALLSGTGFPIDEAYVPFAYARTLTDAGTWALHPAMQSAAGAIAPLYVMLLAVLGFLVGDAFTLAAVVGIGSLAAVAVLVFRIGIRLFPREHWLAATAALLTILVPHVQSTAVSGLGTMLDAALLLGAIHAWQLRRGTLAGVLAALAVWMRPDALVLATALALAAVWQHRFARGEASAPETAVPAGLRGGMLALAAGIVAYIGFNLLVGGSILPTSIDARIATFRALPGSSYPAMVWFSFAHPGATVLLVFMVISLIAVVRDMARRRTPAVLALVLWIGGTALAYWIFYPQPFDDAFMPLMPAVVLAGVWGVRASFGLLAEAIPVNAVRSAGNVLSIIVYAIAAVTALAAWSEARTTHYAAVRYTLDRGVEAAHWLADNTANNAVVATHLPGMIAYEGRRAVIDITGVHTPALAAAKGDLAQVAAYLRTNGATHVATLRERFEVVNVNHLFQTSLRYPEIMEVFPYEAGRTHIMAQPASALLVDAVRLMQSRQFSSALPLLDQAMKLDPRSCRTNTLVGVCFLAMNDTTQAEEFLTQALALHPEYGPAMVPLGDVYTGRKQYTNAYTMLERAYQLLPNSQQVQDSYSRLTVAHGIDSAAAMGQRTMQVTQNDAR